MPKRAQTQPISNYQSYEPSGYIPNRDVVPTAPSMGAMVTPPINKSLFRKPPDSNPFEDQQVPDILDEQSERAQDSEDDSESNNKSDSEEEFDDRAPYPVKRSETENSLASNAPYPVRGISLYEKNHKRKEPVTGQVN